MGQYDRHARAASAGAQAKRLLIRVVGPQVVETFPDYANLPLAPVHQLGNLPHTQTFVQMPDDFAVSKPLSAVAAVPSHYPGVDVARSPAAPPAGPDWVGYFRIPPQQAGVRRFLRHLQQSGLGVVILAALPAPPFVAIQDQVTAAFPAAFQQTQHGSHLRAAIRFGLLVYLSYN